MNTATKLPKTGKRFLSTWLFARDPFSCYRNWRKLFGDSFIVNALNGDVVVLCNREDIRTIFSASFDEVAPFAIETVEPLVGSRSIFLIQGEEHRRERALLSPPFHGQCMRSKVADIQSIAMRASQKWRVDEEFLVMDAALDVSLEVIIRIVFGVQSSERIDVFKDGVKEFVSSFHPALAFSRLLHRPLFGLSPWNRFIRRRDSFYKLLNEQIESQRNAKTNQDSVLAQLIGSTYDDGQSVSNSVICDQLVSMLFAGHETTQIAIAWAMSWLHRRTKYLDQLRAELDLDDSVEAIINSPLLTGICNESLRINSVVSDTIRKLVVPMQFSFGELPAGSNIAIPICLVHEDPELYPEPFEFRPERWDNLKLKPHEFLPFGGGVRRCIGAPLAVMELKLVVATWIKNFEFLLPADAPPFEKTHRRNITMAPRSGIPLVFEGKRDA